VSDSPFSAYVSKYLFDAKGFVRDVLGVKDIYPWQARVLDWYDQRERHIAIRSGHGIGKSTLVSWLMVHHLLMRYPQKTVVTAPSTTQLWDALWATFKSLLTRLPSGWQDALEPASDRVMLKKKPQDSFVSARTSRKETPEALAGVHADQTQSTDNEGVLLIADEAAGIPDEVFESALGSMSGHNAMTILTGNPTRLTGFFHDAHTKNQDMWKTLSVSCLDLPQAVTGDYVKFVERSFGKYSNAYRVRVLGEFPTTESDAIIPFELVELALDRDVKPGPVTTPVVWGVDVARFGDDRSALAKRRSFELIEMVKAWSKLDTMDLAAVIFDEWTSTPFELRPAEINIDSIGIGAGVVDRLKQLGLPARGIAVSESPALMNKERYRDLRTDLWFQGRAWFERRDCKLPSAYKKVEPEMDLIRQLTTQKYDHTPQGKMFALSKKDMKHKYGVDSPDLADAFILTFASNASRLYHGRFASTNWRTAVGRPLKLLQGV